MKLIHVKENDGTERYISPLHVKDITVSHSQYNTDWCIALHLDGRTPGESVYTILCDNPTECDAKFAEIKMAMESI